MAIAPALNPAWTVATATTSITTAAFSPAANSLIVIESHLDTANPTATPLISDSIGMTWTQVGTAQRGVSGGFTAVWWAFTVPARTNMTVTVDWQSGSGNNKAIKPRTYTGTASVSAVVTKAQNSSGTNNLTVNVTNTNDQCRIAGSALDWNALGAPTSTDDEISWHVGGAASGTSVIKAANTTGTGQTVGVNFDAGGAGSADWGYKVYEIVPGASGTDLPYDGEGETPLLNDTPASYSQAAAYAADGKTPRALVQLARAALDMPYASDLLAPRPAKSTAQAAGSVAAAADSRGGRPLPGLARSVLGIEMGADSVGARPVRGIATYELTPSGAQDLAFTAIGVPPRALLAPARAQLDELFRAIPRPFLLADTPARSAVSLEVQADGRTPFIVRNAAARALANQALFALARGGWPARGLALATLGSGAALPVDVVADFAPAHVTNSLAPPVVVADFTVPVVQGWLP